MVQLDDWIAKIHAGNESFHEQTGATKLGLFKAAARLLAGPRIAYQTFIGPTPPPDPPDLQFPWLPLWPGLEARLLHDSRHHPWSELVRQACPDIKQELAAVQGTFLRARYDSNHNLKPWTTFYFYFQGKPIADHLRACPRTAEVLRQIPHHGFHVCFSAIEPGGALHPHTGPTNASLTAHLRLANCKGAPVFGSPGNRQNIAMMNC